LALMPGVGTWLPRRYTARRPRVKQHPLPEVRDVPNVPKALQHRGS
jgi:hypothetical protein